MLDKNAVGRTTPPTLNEVEKGAIRRFAEALGDYNPIYYDEDYARASGFASVVAPPSFPCAFATGADLRELLRPRSVTWKDPTDWMGNVVALKGSYTYSVSDPNAPR